MPLPSPRVARGERGVPGGVSLEPASRMEEKCQKIPVLVALEPGSSGEAHGGQVCPHLPRWVVLLKLLPRRPKGLGGVRG